MPLYLSEDTDGRRIVKKVVVTVFLGLLVALPLAGCGGMGEPAP
jgi:hypothetical protein